MQIVISNFKNLFINFRKHYVTDIISFVCIFSYIISIFLSNKYSSSSAYIVLGADYKMFTLGLKQYYRLLTMMFNHSGILHLFFNLYSFNSIGKYCEEEYGHLKFTVIFVYCVIIGSLTFEILTDNQLALGMSAGLYGITLIVIMKMFKSRVINLSKLAPVLLINFYLNFSSNAAWQAHLGGLIAGLVMYYIFENTENRITYIFVSIVLLGCLFYKFKAIDIITPIYAGTDYEILDVLSDLNLSNYVTKLTQRLLQAYVKYGG